MYSMAVDRDMTGAYVDELQSRFEAEISNAGKRSVILDLSAVRQIDSRGLALCIGLFKECKARGNGFSLLANPDLFRFFRLMKLTKVIDIREGAAV